MNHRNWALSRSLFALTLLFSMVISGCHQADSPRATPASIPAGSSGAGSPVLGYSPVSTPFADMSAGAAVESDVSLVIPLSPFSTWDSDQLKKRLPADQRDQARISSLNVPASQAGGTKFNTSNLFGFRVIKTLPLPESIVAVSEFKLRLVNLKRYVGPFSSKSSWPAFFQDQFLCLMPRHCSGTASSNKLFSELTPVNIREFKINVTNAATRATESRAMMKADTLEIDLLSLFKLNPNEANRWMYEATSSFSNPQRRKFTFVLGNQLFAESGEITLKYRVKNKSLGLPLEEPLGGAANGVSDEKPMAPYPLITPGPAQIEAADVRQVANFSGVCGLSRTLRIDTVKQTEFIHQRNAIVAMMNQPAQAWIRQRYQFLFGQTATAYRMVLHPYASLNLATLQGDVIKVNQALKLDASAGFMAMVTPCGN